MRPGYRRTRGEQNERVQQREVPRIEGIDALGRPDAAGKGDARDVADFIREKRSVEIGPEPGDEKHHLRGDEEDHPVAVRDLHDAGMKALVLRLTNDVAPPDDKGVEHAQHAHAEYERCHRIHMMHPTDGPDRHDKSGYRADCRPWTR